MVGTETTWTSSWAETLKPLVAPTATTWYSPARVGATNEAVATPSVAGTCITKPNPNAPGPSTISTTSPSVVSVVSVLSVLSVVSVVSVVGGSVVVVVVVLVLVVVDVLDVVVVADDVDSQVAVVERPSTVNVTVSPTVQPVTVAVKEAPGPTVDGDSDSTGADACWAGATRGAPAWTTAAAAGAAVRTPSASLAARAPHPTSATEARTAMPVRLIERSLIVRPSPTCGTYHRPLQPSNGPKEVASAPIDHTVNIGGERGRAGRAPATCDVRSSSRWPTHWASTSAPRSAAAAALRDGAVEVVALATHQVVAPTLLFARGDDLVFGTSAGVRGQGEPAGLAREFKRRVGDTVPIVLSGTPYPAARLVALYAKWIVETVTSQFGEAPAAIAVTHPANWTAFQLNALQQSLEEVGLGAVRLLSEPEAAVIDFATVAHIAPGEVHVVYDLGGGTFDVAVLRKLRDGFEQVGQAAGIERLGGVDFDEALFQHVLGQLPSDSVEAARSHPDARQALAQFRRGCVEAKESLSTEDALDVAAVLPGLAATVRVTRDEFEDMIRPVVRQSVALVRAVLTKAKIRDEDVKDVLLIGGSSRIPLVAELIRDELGLPTRIDAHPKLVVARGAARWAGTTPPRRTRDAAATGPGPHTPSADEHHRRVPLVVGGAIVLALAVGGGIFALTRSSDDDAAPPASSPAAVTTEALDTDPVVTPAPPASATPPTTSATPATTVPETVPASPSPTTSVVPIESTPPPSLPVGAEWIELGAPRHPLRGPGGLDRGRPGPGDAVDRGGARGPRRPERDARRCPPGHRRTQPRAVRLQAAVARRPVPQHLRLVGPDQRHAHARSTSKPPSATSSARTHRSRRGATLVGRSGSSTRSARRAPRSRGTRRRSRCRDGAVLITVKTLDMTESIAIGRMIEATISSR